MTNNHQRDWSDAPRQLQLVRAGGSEFGVFADEIAAIVPWREPTQLPGAPASVLGVVSVQGRMVTVLDLVALSAGNENSNETQQNSARQIVALKGDEQLALAVDDAGATITVTPGDFVSKTEDPSALVLGMLRRENSQTRILNLKGLFPASIQGRERRRRRF